MVFVTNKKGKNNDYIIFLILGAVLVYFFYTQIGLFSILIGDYSDKLTITGCGLQGCESGDSIKLELIATDSGTSPSPDSVVQGLVCSESIYGGGPPNDLTYISGINQNSYESELGGGSCGFVCDVPDEVNSLYGDYGTDTYKDRLCAVYAILDGVLYDSTGRLASSDLFTDEGVVLNAQQTETKQIQVWWWHNVKSLYVQSGATHESVYAQSATVDLEVSVTGSTTTTLEGQCPAVACYVPENDECVGYPTCPCNPAPEVIYNSMQECLDGLGITGSTTTTTTITTTTDTGPTTTSTTTTTTTICLDDGYQIVDICGVTGCYTNCYPFTNACGSLLYNTLSECEDALDGDTTTTTQSTTTTQESTTTTLDDTITPPDDGFSFSRTNLIVILVLIGLIYYFVIQKKK